MAGAALSLRARLLHPRHRSSEVEILVQRPLHNPCQLRIIEARPPLVERRRRQTGSTSLDGGGTLKRLQQSFPSIPILFRGLCVQLRLRQRLPPTAQCLVECDET